MEDPVWTPEELDKFDEAVGLLHEKQKEGDAIDWEFLANHVSRSVDDVKAFVRAYRVDLPYTPDISQLKRMEVAMAVHGHESQYRFSSIEQALEETCTENNVREAYVATDRDIDFILNCPLVHLMGEDGKLPKEIPKRMWDMRRVKYQHFMPLRSDDQVTPEQALRAWVMEEVNPDKNEPMQKGLWTEEEHRRFLIGLQEFGKGKWKDITNYYVKSRDASQVASHAQKYFMKLNKTRPVKNEIGPVLNLSIAKPRPMKGVDRRAIKKKVDG